jgi:hypothetical protein
MAASHADIPKPSRQGLGPAEIADRLGEPRIVITQIRARMGLRERRSTTKPGDPERAERLLGALKEYWQRGELEWPEIAPRFGSSHGIRSRWSRSEKDSLPLALTLRQLPQ